MEPLTLAMTAYFSFADSLAGLAAQARALSIQARILSNACTAAADKIPCQSSAELDRCSNTRLAVGELERIVDSLDHLVRAEESFRFDPWEN